MNLLVDIGNTRIKIAIDNDGVIYRQGSIFHKEKGWLSHLSDMFHELASVERADEEFSNVYVSNVNSSRIGEQITAFAAESFQITPRFAKTQKSFGGLKNAYSVPETLGIDRWLAMIAAHERRLLPMIVVDCGTAVTIDTINDEGIFVGGLILPGLTLMRQSLDTNTAHLDSYSGNASEEGFTPYSTVSAVQAGTAYAIASLIDRAMRELSRKHGKSVNCYIAGGDALEIKEKMEMDAIYEPDLVLQGLAKYFRDN